MTPRKNGKTDGKNLKNFQNSWLEEEELKDFVAIVKDDSNKFRCKVCNKTLTLSTEGRPAVVRHKGGAKHKEAAEKIKKFFAKSLPIDVFVVPNSPDAQPIATVREPQQKQATITQHVTTEEVLTAEIIWVLQTVLNGFSFSSCDGMGDNFRRMLKGNEVAQKFRLGRTKIGYVVNYGLGPYFKELMIESVKKSPVYCLSFDESLSEVLQKCEMVVMVRFWDSDSNTARVHYLGSAFFGHSRHNNLLDEFGKITKCLEEEKVFQISMDGPIVNKKFYQNIAADRSEKLFHTLMDLGTCSLHSINGSVKNGFKTEYMKNMTKVLKGVFQLLHSSPARRDDYQSITGSTKFPLFFCATRWVENKKVAERLIEIWPNVVAVVKFWSSFCKSKQPKCKSFENVKLAVEEDQFIVAKLKFFSFICGFVEPYLKKFQTQKPMVPFMFGDLKGIVKSFLQLIVKPDVIDKCSSAKNLIALKLDDSNLMKACDISMGFAVKKCLQEMVQKDTVTKRQINTFKSEGCTVITTILKQLYERSPLSINALRYCGMFDPGQPVQASKKVLMKYLKGLLDHLMTCKIMSPSDCDSAVVEYTKFLSVDLPKLETEFANFDETKDRLDELWFGKVGIHKYPQISRILKLIFCLFHGQASVEREFNDNNIVDQVNMEDDTIVAKKHVLNHMRFHKINPKDINIDKPMIKAVKNSHKLYLIAQEKKLQEKKNTDIENRKLALAGDIKDVQKKCSVLEKAIKDMADESDKCFKRAEKKNDMSLVIKGNSLKRSCEESRTELLKLEEVQKDLQEKRKKL